MKKTHFLYLFTIILAACEKNEDQLSSDIINEIPIVKAVSTYNVIFDEDIVYAQGLSHQSVNSSNATPIPLKLDVYYPDGNSLNRPAYLFIHGGGSAMRSL